jgi:D-alanine-D-alanine ligase
MNTTKIGLVYDLYENHKPKNGQPQDFYAEFDSITTITKLAQTLQEIGYEIDLVGGLDDLVSRLAARNYTWDIVFNIAEGIYGRARQAQVPALLEAYNIPFIGSDALTHGVVTDKALTKKIWKSHNLPTADFFVLSDEKDFKDFENKPISLPLFIKPCFAGSSAGISQDALIIDYGDLRDRVVSLWKAYQQPVIVESFLSGDEFTVGIVGNGHRTRVLGALSQLSSDAHGIRGSNEKKEYQKPEDFCAPIEDKVVEEKVIALALEAYRTVNCRDLARVDIRADQTGEFNLMEINALVNLDVVSSFNYMAGLKKVTYKELINNIVVDAYSRYYSEDVLV